MTDITEQDLRDAREWAEDVAETFKYDNEVSRETRAAVNYILATVDAPAPTLAEELRDLARNLANTALCGGDTSDPASDELLHLATRADQMETEWEEELDQISADRDHWCAENARLIDKLERVRDEARAEMERERDLGVALAHERDDARAEVERLTAERDREKTISKGWMEAHQKLAEHHAETLECAVQKDAESSDLPDPADVPYGEAWLVEYHGDDLPALRRLDHPGDWYLVRKNGTGGHVRSQDITLVSRLVPAPSQITTREELDALPRRTVIRDADGATCERASIGAGWYTTETTSDQTAFITFPATVLWEPQA